MTDREEIVEIFSELRNFADNDIHPVVSPENWQVYSKLRELIDQAEEDVLAMLKEQEPVEPFEEGINDFNCGKCGAGLSVDNDWKYCPHCGKKVKWD